MKITMNFKIKDDKLKKFVDGKKKAVTAALIREANEVLADAIVLTPVDTSALRQSGKVVVKRWDLVAVEFGGGSVTYARVVHEDLDAKHPVGQAKYLETATLRRERGYHSRMATFLDMEGFWQ